MSKDNGNYNWNDNYNWYVHKKIFLGRAYVSQIDDPSYYICKELTKILNPLDEKGESFLRDTYHFKESIRDVEVQDRFNWNT